MYSIKQQSAMGIILFAVVATTVSYDKLGDLITHQEELEAFTSLAEAEEFMASL